MASERRYKQRTAIDINSAVTRAYISIIRGDTNMASHRIESKLREAPQNHSIAVTHDQPFGSRIIGSALQYARAHAPVQASGQTHEVGILFARPHCGRRPNCLQHAALCEAVVHAPAQLQTAELPSEWSKELQPTSQALVVRLTTGVTAIEG